VGQTREERKIFLFFKLLGTRRARECKRVLDRPNSVIQKDTARFKVISSVSSIGYYDVMYDFNKKVWSCGCDGNKNLGAICKHINAVKVYMMKHSLKVDLY
jgi:hypothetical protein